MTVAMGVFCDGTLPNGKSCDERIVKTRLALAAPTSNIIRLIAQGNGWQHTKKGDFCPAHAKRRVAKVSELDPSDPGEQRRRDEDDAELDRRYSS